MPGRGVKRPKEATGPTGGIFFFASLLSLLFLAVATTLALPALVTGTAIVNLSYFCAFAAVGALLAGILIRGRTSVFIHEFKHSLLSHFAGNKGKEMRVRRNSGHFTYEFTKETERFNAMIALAPYWVPVFTVPAIAAAHLAIRDNPLLMISIVGTAYGADLLLNMRDISPHQSDLTNIRGGYLVALLYLIGMNLSLIAILLAWVLQGPSGLLKLAAEIIRTMAALAGLGMR